LTKLNNNDAVDVCPWNNPEDDEDQKGIILNEIS